MDFSIGFGPARGLILAVAGIPAAGLKYQGIIINDLLLARAGESVKRSGVRFNQIALLFCPFSAFYGAIRLSAIGILDELVARWAPFRQGIAV